MSYRIAIIKRGSHAHTTADVSAVGGRCLRRNFPTRLSALQHIETAKPKCAAGSFLTPVIQVGKSKRPVPTPSAKK